MQPLFSQKELKSAKSRQLLDLKCLHCQSVFQRPKNEILKVIKKSKGLTLTLDFCNRSCVSAHRKNSQEVKCKQCQKTFSKALREIKKSKNNFCSRSCSATYNNTHKTHGIKRSKCEAWIEENLKTIYPTLTLHFNQKDAINSELDIYVPSLKLAFEINGIFHYEPIFSEAKLEKIQNNDARKYQACIESHIELCIINMSDLKYFKPKNAQKYLDIIVNIIDSKLV